MAQITCTELFRVALSDDQSMIPNVNTLALTLKSFQLLPKTWKNKLFSLGYIAATGVHCGAGTIDAPIPVCCTVHFIFLNKFYWNVTLGHFIKSYWPACVDCAWKEEYCTQYIFSAPMNTRHFALAYSGGVWWDCAEHHLASPGVKAVCIKTENCQRGISMSH